MVRLATRSRSFQRPQIEQTVFELLRQYGDEEWESVLAQFLETAVTLKARYAQQRTLNRVPVQVAADQEITLSAGKHSILIKQIMWVASSPSHLIHFDGVRFLGPYGSEDKL